MPRSVACELRTYPDAWRCFFLSWPSSSIFPSHAHAGRLQQATGSHAWTPMRGHSMPRRLRSGATGLRAGRLRCLYSLDQIDPPAHGDGEGDIGRCARTVGVRLHGWCTAAVRPTTQGPPARASQRYGMQVRMHAPRRPNLPRVNFHVQSIRHAGTCARVLGAPCTYDFSDDGGRHALPGPNLWPRKLLLAHESN